MLRSSTMGMLRSMTRGKFGQNRGKRGPLNAKRGNKNFMKGYGAKRQGRHTKKGTYILDPAKLMVIDAPDLTGCDLKPYVASTTPKVDAAPTSA